MMPTDDTTDPRRAPRPRTARRALLLAAVMLMSPACDGADEPARDAGADTGVDPCQQPWLGCACDSGACLEGECVEGVCSECARGDAGCACFSNGACNEGASCAGALCAPCAAGTADCPCDEGACGDGLQCRGEVCVPIGCPEGEDGCACRLGGVPCEGALYCDDNGLCRACADDVPGCPCDPGAPAGALRCASNGVWVPCDADAPGCACDAGGECDPGLFCDDGSCALCTADIVGCPCNVDSTCEAGLVCDAGACRGPVLCADLRAAGGCPESQLCEQPEGMDARCIGGSCEAGFFWDADAETCAACTEQQCPTPPTCEAGVTGSIAAQCLDQSKHCVEDGGGARCEGCFDGYVDVNGECVQLPCGEDFCGQDEYCDVGSVTCMPRPCGDGQAETVIDTCADCRIRCDGPGLTGRVWPYQNTEDECICETTAGYYMPTDSNSVAEACDADGDGWVRRESDTGQVRADPAHRDNARCSIRTVDGVWLQDELGTRREVASCAAGEGLVMEPGAEGAPPCGERIPLRLLESRRNDLPQASASPRMPTYDHALNVGNGGRPLRGKELNGLTKACVSALGDFDDDGSGDLNQVQARPAEVGDDDQARLRSFAFFMELYRSWYEPAAPGAPGKLVIAERSRCDLDAFFLRYDDAVDDVAYQRMDNTDNPTYWRNCTRRRDADYEVGVVGVDFGQWDCDADSGSCDAVQPPHATLDPATFDSSERLLRGHGICEAIPDGAADGLWRGFHHHSQFKCVQISSVLSPEPPRHGANAFTHEGGPPSMILNLCEATGESTPNAPGADSTSPTLRCSAHDPDRLLPPEVTVAWGAVTFQPYGTYGSNGDYSASGDYARGCISEDAEWGTRWLCPYPGFGINAYPRSDSFGRYSCGEDRAFLWAFPDEPSNWYDEGTLWWDGTNGQGTETVLR